MSIHPRQDKEKATEIDWAVWIPVERATLLFVVRDGRILLIHKKKGLGAGKINGPGGRVDPGESPWQAAIREVEEELSIHPLGVTAAGMLRFQFLDGYRLLGYVFRATDYRGNATETDEAVPLWFPVDSLPYSRMWADDPLWMPHLLACRLFEGYFVFDGDRLLEHRVEVVRRLEI